ncbi:HTTM domain-containing protein [bacterium]|jgi:hypothetical protein|nr:HTTM domain-containing protein [bacterium]
MNNIIAQFIFLCRKQFATEIDGAALGFFRILWGALMVYEGIRKLPKASGLYSADYFHFKYALTPFIQPLPENWMVTCEIWIMILSAAMVAIGLGFRFFNTIFAILYTHLFLIDKMYFNNHFYLTSLLAFLLSFTAADHCFSIRSWWRTRKGNSLQPLIPYWHLFILRAQVVIVYFFGGVAKLQGDWLQGEPLRHWMKNKPVDLIKAPFSWFPQVLQEEWFIWAMSYGGLVFDISIGFLLLCRKTFWPAAAVVVLFHITNNALFSIGLFPFIGIGLLALFFQPHWPRPIQERLWSKKLERPRNRKKKISTAHDSENVKPKLASVGVTIFILVYLAVHCVLPFRALRYGGDPSWSEVGHYYSWRMMLRDKDSYLKFFFNPPEAEKILEESGRSPKIGKSHVVKMVKNPHMILQFAHALDETFKEMNLNGVEIRAAAISSLNGRPYQLLIDPEVDLTKASYGFFEVPGWIIPLEEDIRPGLYPTNSEERKKAIAKVFDELAAPELKKTKRKKFMRPVEEILSELVTDGEGKAGKNKATKRKPEPPSDTLLDKTKGKE